MSADADAPRPHVLVERSVARVVAEDSEQPVGLAFALGNRMLTCAHVVNEALGRESTEWNAPDEESRIRLEFPSPHSPPRVRFATVAGWWPSRTRPWTYLRDIAVLELDEPHPDGVQRAQLGSLGYGDSVRVYVPDPRHDVHLSGVLMGSVAGSGFPVEVDAAFPVSPGLSGGPVWIANTGRVIGMVVTRATGPSRVDIYLIPSDVLDLALHPDILLADGAVAPPAAAVLLDDTRPRGRGRGRPVVRSDAADEPDAPTDSIATTQLYLSTSNLAVAEQFELAFVQLFDSLGIHLFPEGPAEWGSWKRRYWFRREGSENEARRRLEKLEHALEVVAVRRPMSETNANQAEAIAKLAAAADLVDEFVAIADGVVFVKVTADSGQTKSFVKTLSVAEVRAFERDPSLASNASAAMAYVLGRDRAMTQVDPGQSATDPA